MFFFCFFFLNIFIYLFLLLKCLNINFPTLEPSDRLNAFPISLNSANWETWAMVFAFSACWLFTRRTWSIGPGWRPTSPSPWPIASTIWKWCTSSAANRYPTTSSTWASKTLSTCTGNNTLEQSQEMIRVRVCFPKLKKKIKIVIIRGMNVGVTSRVNNEHLFFFLLFSTALQFGETERGGLFSRFVLHSGSASSQVRPTTRIDARSLPYPWR